MPILIFYAVISPVRPWTHGSGYAAYAGLGREVNMNKRTIAHVEMSYKSRIAGRPFSKTPKPHHRCHW